VIIAVVVTVAAIVGGYLIYLRVSVQRLPDRQALDVSYSQNSATDPDPDRFREDEGSRLRTGTAYRAVTYNLGFGAFDHDFSFFMSENRTVDGDSVKGLMSRAESEDVARKNIGAAVNVVTGLQSDFAVFQEIDRNAGRSYGIDELALITRTLTDGLEGGNGFFANAYATNFHTGWLFWPPARPMGRVSDSGMATYSRYAVDEAERRNLPIDDSFFGRLFDLDRCFTVMRLPVTVAEELGGEDAAGELVLIGVHLSAYDAGEKMRGEQMKVLADFMKEEREKGNWVIAGGDWNQSFPGSLDAFKGRMETPGWATPFMEDILPEGFSLVGADNADVIATCRDTSIPWTPGVSYETIFDGWVASDNVAASVENIDTDYAASDHNPVLLTFTLR
jgi:endonuclease/exonuclease/phosphatase family metal-dependent hydrolase